MPRSAYRPRTRPATTSEPPARSHEQRLSALKRANEIRTWRAGFKRQLKSQPAERSKGATCAAILAPAAKLESMQVVRLLRATRGVGPVKANRVLRAALVSPSKTLGGLTERQRSMLVAMLSGGGR